MTELTNLLEETNIILKNYKKSLDDIVFCQIEDYYFLVDDFIELAGKTNYNEGFGTAKINEFLLLVGKDFWLERREYDGTEWWTFNIKPKKPKTYKKPQHLYSDVEIQLRR